MSGRLRMKLMALITFVNVIVGVTLGGLLYTIWPERIISVGIPPSRSSIGSQPWR